MSDQQQTLSIPSLLLFAALSALAVRYFFFTTASSPSSITTSRGTPQTANPADVDRISQMFPQIERRDIVWDLQRNGGSVAATTERILSRGGLDTPPPTFQPALPFIPPLPGTLSTARATPAQSTPEQIDLIKRYNLSSKLSSPPSTTSQEEAGLAAKVGWSNNKNERQALLQRRREEMVLQARRKMEERESAKAVSS